MISILSAILLASGSLDTLREHNLDSPEGRTIFLTEKLTPYVAKADQLNQEIISLSQQVTEKMALMNEILPILNMALRVNTDFEQLDAILNSEELTTEQQEVADRIAAICRAVDAGSP